MSKKKVTVILEGNPNSIEEAVHELHKLTSQADNQPELTATIQTAEIRETDHEPHFEQGDTSGP